MNRIISGKIVWDETQEVYIDRSILFAYMDALWNGHSSELAEASIALDGKQIDVTLNEWLAARAILRDMGLVTIDPFPKTSFSINKNISIFEAKKMIATSKYVEVVRTP